MSEPSGLTQHVVDFVSDVVEAMGLDLDVTTEIMADHVRINLDGPDGEVLLRRKGEALDALQHIVNSAFREDGEGQRLVVDCMGFRKSKDRELQQMAAYLVERARTTGMPQEMGPLNSYARRIVHLEVGTHADMTSESQGDGALKSVIIARRELPRERH